MTQHSKITVKILQEYYTERLNLAEHWNQVNSEQLI